jgi:hypothetical protein
MIRLFVVTAILASSALAQVEDVVQGGRLAGADGDTLVFKIANQPIQ